MKSLELGITPVYFIFLWFIYPVFAKTENKLLVNSQCEYEYYLNLQEGLHVYFLLAFTVCDNLNACVGRHLDWFLGPSILEKIHDNFLQLPSFLSLLITKEIGYCIVE